MSNDGTKHICVCFKIIDDFDEVMPSDWETADETGPDVSYVRRILGDFDEAALENALRVKDVYHTLGMDADLTAVTVAPGHADHIFKNFAAIGVDHTVCIETPEDLRFNPKRTASVMADFIMRNTAPDIVIAGLMTPPGGSGAVPLFLTEYLGLPCITDVISLMPSKDCVMVEHRVDAGICRCEMLTAFLCTVGNARHSYLRIPTLLDTLRAPASTIEHIESEAAEPCGGFNPVSVCREHRERQCLFAEGSDAVTKAAFLYERVIKGVLK
jgi:electron transfer flavoprotein alpha/beta subunit